jgi:hypothetical protein
MAKKKEVKAPQGPTCGNCLHWNPIDTQEVGECFSNPPTIGFEDGEPYMVRPILEPAEQACGHFKAKQ